MKLSLGGVGGHDFGPSMKKYQDAKKRYKAALNTGNKPNQRLAIKDLDLAELEMIAMGAPGAWCAAVFPWSKAGRAIAAGTTTAKMDAARAELKKQGRWPL